MSTKVAAGAQQPGGQTQIFILACPQCGAKNACRLHRHDGDPNLKRVKCFRCQGRFTIGEARKVPVVRRGKAVSDDQVRLVGTTIGKFFIEKIAGVGAIGAVFCARDTLLNRPVALKVLPAWATHSDPVQFKRFVLEAQTAAKLVHPNVVQIYQIEEANQYWYIAMEYMSGGSLAQHTANNTPIEPMTATQLILQACSALVAAHEQGIVHRDIKPGNLLITSDGTLKVADFGLAKLASAAGALTPGARLIGTPHYMSPEQCRGEPATGQSDIYSLAATYFTLLTGRLPFDAENVTGYIHKHLTAPPPDPRDHDVAVPQGIVQAIQRGMAKAPAERYASVVAFREAIQSAMPDVWLHELFRTSMNLNSSGRLSLSGMALTDSGSGDNGSNGTTPITDESKSSRKITPLKTSQAAYAAAFRLREPPFQESLRLATFWDGGPFAQARTKLRDYLNSGECLVMLEAGSGAGASITALASAQELTPFVYRPASASNVRFFRGQRIEDPGASGSTEAVAPGGPSGTPSFTHVDGVPASLDVGSIRSHAMPAAVAPPPAAPKVRYFRGQAIVEPGSNPPASTSGSRSQPAPGHSRSTPASGVSGGVSNNTAVQHTHCVAVAIRAAQIKDADLVSAAFAALQLELPAETADGYSEVGLEQALGKPDLQPMVLIVDDFELLPHSAIVDLLALARIGAKLRARLRVITVGKPGSWQRLVDALPPEAAGGRHPPVVTLAPMTLAECDAYLQHRLANAGMDTPGMLFSNAAVVMLADRSGGLPRALNVLAHEAFCRAFEQKRRRVLFRNVPTLAEAQSTEPAKPADPPANGKPDRAIGSRGMLARAVRACSHAA